jgi:hypothetical protein
MVEERDHKDRQLGIPVTEAVKINKKAIFALFLVHFIGDFFQSFSGSDRF